MGGPKCINGYCEIPAGTFQMGSTNGDADEQPVRNITMSGFQLRQTEVSVGSYRAFLEKNTTTQLQAVVSGCGTTGTSRTISATQGETKEQLRKRAVQVVVSEECNVMSIVQETPKGVPNFGENKKGDNYPVVGLTYNEKLGYCQKAEGGTLPTAAQLHFASRFDERDIPADQLVIWDNGFRSTEPVGSGKQNRFGIVHLLGNVRESALDAYDPKFYAYMGSKDPYNPLADQSAQMEEFSGGSFSLDRWFARAASRFDGYPVIRSVDSGFRCVRSLPQDSK